MTRTSSAAARGPSSLEFEGMVRVMFADQGSLADLRAVVSERHPAFMAPKERVVIDEVPRTALGKVVRSALASGHAPSSD